MLDVYSETWKEVCGCVGQLVYENVCTCTIACTCTIHGQSGRKIVRFSSIIMIPNSTTFVSHVHTDVHVDVHNYRGM